MRKEIKRKLGLFAGTTEGRLLVEWIRENCEETAVLLDVFVATEYGKEGLPGGENIRVFCRRMDREEISRVFEGEKYDLVIDATHPYAAVVSENVKAACETAGIRRMRVLRESAGVRVDAAAFGTAVLAVSDDGAVAASGFSPMAGGSPVISVGNVKEAVEFLKGTEGPVLVTTGSKELSKFKELPGWEERIYARVLSLPQVVSACGDMGFYGSHLIAMQGPFSVEMNLAMLNSVGARWMVTKESGKAGGFEEKEEAAKRAGAGLIVIGRLAEEGISLEEAVKELAKALGDSGAQEEADLDAGGAQETAGLDVDGAQEAAGLDAGGAQEAVGLDVDGVQKGAEKTPVRHVWLVGAGPGGPECLTKEAMKLLKECDLIAGAGRVVDGLPAMGKPILREYQPEKILEFLKNHPEYKNLCVALSGDTGFYSGAKKLREVFLKEQGTEVTVVPGISSVNYFFAKIGETWEDACLMSLHGRDGDLVSAVREHEKVFVLSGGPGTLKEICGRLTGAGFRDVRLTVGENLSLPGEKIYSGSLEELGEREIGSLAVVLIENPAWKETCASLVTPGLSDDAFIRDKVPMTKMEVRTVSVAKLQLTADAVVYDVGAGTGSVSVECARLSDKMTVYAIERNPEAVELLRKNRERFGLCNMEIVEGTAPEALDGLPVPTHVFIGGSGGKMKETVEAVLLKNPSARFVINLITLESLAVVTGILKSLPVTDVEIVQLTVARAKKAGSSHLMMGQNPVWIVSFAGSTDKRGEEYV